MLLGAQASPQPGGVVGGNRVVPCGGGCLPCNCLTCYSCRVCGKVVGALWVWCGCALLLLWPGL